MTMNKDDQKSIIELKVIMGYMRDEITELKDMVKGIIKDSSLTNNALRADYNALSDQYIRLSSDVSSIKRSLDFYDKEIEDTKTFKQNLRFSGNLLKLLIGSNVIAFVISVVSLIKLLS